MAKNPEFKNPPDVRVKQPESTGLFGEEPAAAETPVSPTVEWLDIPFLDDLIASIVSTTRKYPFNGEPVWLTSDGETEYLAIWRVTREYRDGRFQPTAFWAVHNGGGVKIDFEPIGYRRYEPPLYVPKKSA